jgi:hypothetical protein
MSDRARTGAFRRAIESSCAPAMSCAGPMIYDEDHYFGRTINIAAHIASQAGPDQVYGTDRLVCW